MIHIRAANISWFLVATLITAMLVLGIACARAAPERDIVGEPELGIDIQADLSGEEEEAQYVDEPGSGIAAAIGRGKKSSKKKSSVRKSGSKKSSVKRSGSKKPSVKRSVDRKPTSERPSIERPASRKPGVERPSDGRPSSRPSIDRPTRPERSMADRSQAVSDRRAERLQQASDSSRDQFRERLENLGGQVPDRFLRRPFMPIIVGDVYDNGDDETVVYIYENGEYVVLDGDESFLIDNPTSVVIVDLSPQIPRAFGDVELQLFTETDPNILWANALLDGLNELSTYTLCVGSRFIDAKVTDGLGALYLEGAAEFNSDTFAGETVSVLSGEGCSGEVALEAIAP